MKVYSISKWAFRAICLLILLLPVSRHWKVLSTGERTKGMVKAYTNRIVEDIMGEKNLVHASEIVFEVAGTTHKTYGPRNYEYPLDRQVTIFYMRNDPSHNCVATFSGFYLSSYSILPLVLITVWYAFYLSFNNYRRKIKMPKGKPTNPPVPF